MAHNEEAGEGVAKISKEAIEELSKVVRRRG
jgi:hypothetical protein